MFQILYLGLHVYGFRTVFGRSEYFFREVFLSKNTMTKIGISYFILVCGIAVTFDAAIAMFVHFFTLLIFNPVKKIIFFKRKCTLLQAFPEWLHVCEIQLKMGTSLVSSLKKIKDNEVGWKKSFLDAVLHSLEFKSDAPIGSNFESVDLKRHILNLHVIQNARMNQIDLLSQFKQQLIRELDFRHRSGQILMQSRLQIVVVLFLHICLSAFAVHTLNLREMLAILTLSSVLIITGSAISFWISKKMDWSY